MPALQVYARRPFVYGGQTGPELTLDPGQVLDLQGTPRDEKLLEYGHLARFNGQGGRVVPVPCNRCGALFVDPSAVTAHGRKRHPERPRDQYAEMVAAEQEDRMLTRTAPLRETLDRIEVTTEAPQAPKRGRGRPRKSVATTN